MINSRNKGARIEREAAKALAAVTGLPHERGARNGVPGADDCVGWPGVHEEVKARKKIAALRWLDQSIADAGDDLPIVVMKEDSGPFVLMLLLEDLPELVEKYTLISRPETVNTLWVQPEGDTTPVWGTRGAYTAHRDGTIIRAKRAAGTRRGRRVRGWLDRGGYVRVCLSGRGTEFLHKIIAECFLGPRPEGLVVNHIDGDKQNNRAGNLEYVTYQENSIHARDSGLSGSKLCREDVDSIFRESQRGTSQQEIARKFGISQPSVSRVLSGNTWSSSAQGRPTHPEDR